MSEKPCGGDGSDGKHDHEGQCTTCDAWMAGEMMRFAHEVQKDTEKNKELFDQVYDLLGAAPPVERVSIATTLLHAIGIDADCEAEVLVLQLQALIRGYYPDETERAQLRLASHTTGRA